MKSIGGLIIVCTLLSGCALPVHGLYPPRGDDRETLYVLDNHWHTGLILPYERLSSELKSQLQRFSTYRYVVIGWGDADFFRAAQVTAGLVARALFFSRGSVILVFGIDSDPQNWFDANVSVYRIEVSHAGMDRMINAIDQSFVHADGRFLNAGPGENNGQFFVARGHYSLFHTCNQWTAQTLRTAGLPITSAHAGFASNLEFQLQLIGADDGRPHAAAPARKITAPDHGILR